jgi:UDP-glucose 4-epimerase
MTVAITGASGNVGTALLRRLAAAGVREVRGLARRQPPDTEPYAGVSWYLTDLGTADSEEVLAEFLEGVDAVVHLAWALIPDRRPEVLQAVNVDGTRRVLEAAGAAGVPHVVHMSSIGTYAAGPQVHPVGEDWPISGIPSSQYSRLKADCERLVAHFAVTHPEATVSVTRPTLVLQPDAASEIGRYFLGPLLFPAVRAVPGAVAKLLPLPLPFNFSAPPIFDADGLAGALGTRRVPVPAFALRAGMHAAFRARVLQLEPGWLDLGIGVPPLDTTRARTVLDWRATHNGGDLLREFVGALSSGAGHAGPLLHPGTGPEHTPA